ncbi:MAG: methyl-accepting chemotaxis protein [Desulfuromonadaceae bacterium]|nr:methyl-accepting chemotaxis protein [Desulfuromonadaceae bacterium]MDD5104719.1 methyl-accepting chemotaxis protein [Desulfuromonadaceae bacterium]
MSQQHATIASPVGKGFGIATKILLAASLALLTGLIIVGGSALYLEKQALVGLQRENSLTFANVMGDDIKNAMMADDMKKVDSYIKEVMEKKRAVAFSIFNEKGDERGSGTKGDSHVMDVLKSNKPASFEGSQNGIHILETVLPLTNEERCQGCHDKETTILGVLKLNTSIEQGYDASKEATVMLLVAGAVALVVSFICLLIVLRIVVTRKINDFVVKVTDLARGEGDLTKKITVSSNDEFGVLANEINSLVEKIRKIIFQIDQTSAQVSSSATQLQANAEQMATGAEEVAAQAETVATAGEEMSATSGDIAQNCQMASEGAQQASAAAVSGAQVVDETIKVMNSIAERVRCSAVAVESLGSRSDQIGEIVGTIEDIADQTNLLALNAAIEAARAGEQGRGFAVVADEVRALAERTTRATREIGEMIKAIQHETKGAVIAMEEGVSEVARGSEKAGDSGKALEQILQQINDVNGQIHQVATAAEEQTATTSEISNNMQQITEVVIQTSRGAQDSAAAAQHLSTLAGDLRRIVSQFKIA